MPEARGQARSNSGVYLHDCYEIQVLDSFGLEGKDDECGGSTVARAGREHVLPAADVADLRLDFTAPKYKDGKKAANARVQVRHNGVVSIRSSS